MNWKGRQMFGGGPSGIVQMMGGGMTPYPTHTMPNGTVMPGAVHGQGYQAGGMAGPMAPAKPSMEQRIAQIAAQQGKSVPEMKAQILQKTATDQGLQLPPEAIQQYAVGMISLQDALSQGIPTMQTSAMEGPTESVQSTGPQMQTGSMGAMPMQQPNAQIQMQAGGMVGAELFEEGDSDINNALNTMASVSNPEVPDMPASNGMALPSGEMGGGEMTMDQGSGYEEDVMQLKDRFKNEIRSYVSQSGTTDLQSYLQKMDVVYSNQLNKIKKKHNVTEALPGDALMTEDFLTELSSGSEMPSYKHGGKVHQPELDAKFGVGQISLDDWDGLNDEQRAIIGRKLILAKLERDQVTPTTGVDRSAYDALTQERRENAKRLGAAAKANYGSTSSRASQHYADAKNTGEATEAMAMDKILADQISQEQSLLGAQARATGKGIGGLDIGFNAAESERFTLGNLLKKEQEQEQVDALWLAIQKANNYKDFGESIGRHLTSTGGKLPTLLKDKRIYTNPITKGDDQGTLLDFYKLVMQVKTDEDGKTLTGVDLIRRQNALMNKWLAFQLYEKK